MTLRTQELHLNVHCTRARSAKLMNRTYGMVTALAGLALIVTGCFSPDSCAAHATDRPLCCGDDWRVEAQLAVIDHLSIKEFGITSVPDIAVLAENPVGAFIVPMREVQLTDECLGSDHDTKHAGSRRIISVRGSGLMMASLDERTPVRRSFSPLVRSRLEGSMYNPETTVDSGEHPLVYGLNVANRPSALSPSAAWTNSPLGLPIIPKPGEQWVLGATYIRDLLLPGGDLGLLREIAVPDPDGVDASETDFSPAFLLAQMESVIGTLIDKAIDRGWITGSATMIAPSGSPENEADGAVASVYIDIEIVAELERPCEGISTLHSDDTETSALLLRPLLGLSIDRAVVRVTVEGTGKVRSGRCEGASQLYEGNYSTGISIDCEIELTPLGYSVPGRLHCFLSGQRSVVATRKVEAD